MANLFKKPEYTFFWQDIKTYLIRSQYNELLHFVVKEYFNKQYTTTILPKFLDKNYALTLVKLDDRCRCEVAFDMPISTTNVPSTTHENLKKDYLKKQNAYENSQDKLLIARRALGSAYKTFIFEKGSTISKAESDEIANIKFAIDDKKADIMPYTTFKSLITTTAAVTALAKLKTPMETFTTANEAVKAAKIEAEEADYKYNKAVDQVKIQYEDAKTNLHIAQRNYALTKSPNNEKAVKSAEIDERAKAKEVEQISKSYAASSNSCVDVEANYFCAPQFTYLRKMSLEKTPDKFDITFTTEGLTVGSVIWLYYYERMGIFKILGTLLDDYNYRGKYTISGSRKSSGTNSVDYSTLMDMICTLHRLGISSNLRDRICTYQRVLGVTIENNLGIESEQNTGFMQTFNKLLDYMLEYYKAKQLAVAINSGNEPRSSVATQTSILDTMNVLQQQFEPMQYGRNQINTFLGLATVHATICLINMLKAEIGIPTQYDKPEEFIPAAYDILVAKRPVTLNESNRFIIHDNCASYGYRLLTDIETANINEFTSIASGATLDTWLNDVESWVEGYRNAVKSIPEPASAIV